MLTYDIFYRHSGVRLPQHLMTPIINPIDKFEFPKNALYNSISFDGIRTAPANDEYLFRSIKKQILIDHITTLTSFDGNPRKINTPILPYIREFHVHNRRFKYSKGMVGIDRDQNTLMVTNYDFAHKLYRYARNRLTEAYKWHNLNKTMCDTMEEHANVSQRQQFVISDLPKILPSVQSLVTYSKLFNSNYLKLFPTPEAMFILDIWKWLGEDTRVDSNLSSISLKNLNKINIVYKDSGKWIMFNLGVLNNWRSSGNEDETDLEAPKKDQIRPLDLQKRFLRMLMSLMHVRNEIPLDQVESAEVDSTNGTSELAPTEPGENTAIDPVLEENLINGVVVEDDESKTHAANRLLASIDDDLKQLEVIENIKTAGLIEDETDENGVPIELTREESNVSIADFHKEILPEDAIIKICNRQADDGIITAAVFRNLVTAATTYKTIPAPKGEGTLETFIQIPQEHLTINESDPIKAIDTVIDKSMLKSSLLSFDERYVSNVLSKDVAGMVVNIQKAGVILNDYKVEKFSEVLGDYEMHTMRVRPVEGVSSVLRFKVPTVSDEGTITYNGNKYRLRKQRGD